MHLYDDDLKYSYDWGNVYNATFFPIADINIIAYIFVHGWKD